MLVEVLEAFKLAEDNDELYPGEDILNVVEYEDLYQVTSFGRIWGVKRQNWLIRTINSHGYYKVNLCKDGIAYNYDVHRLVIEAFKEIPDNLKGQYVECRHKDGNKLNVHINNLEWGTHSNNEQDKYNHGTDNEGERNGRTKLSEESVLEIREMYNEGFTIRRLSQLYKMSTTNIRRIVYNQLWTHI